MRAAGVLAIVGGGAVAGAAAGAGALGAVFARRVLTPAAQPEAGVEILRDEAASGERPRTVWLRGPDAGLPGRYSFIWGAESRATQDRAGHARLGPVLERVQDGAGERIRREVLSIEREAASGSLRAGARGRVTGWWFSDPAQLGFETNEVRLPVEGGSARAWVILPGPEAEQPGRWAVHVHGRGALPEETLRGVTPFARAGITSLVISYRNDPGAPRGLRGRYGLGLAERRDVDVAIAWARERGARRVSLVGWSMGGTAAVLAATRGPLRGLVDGLVLDSPALDWPGVLRQQAALAGAPDWAAAIGGAMLQHGLVRGAVPGERGTDLAALTPEALAAELEVPVLIHAGPGDTFVPWAGAQRFARLRPELVSLRETAGEHVKLWNTDPEGWERATAEFLQRL